MQGTKSHKKFMNSLIIAAFAGVAMLAGSAHRAQAQSVKKAEADVHHALKTAGNDIKADAKDVGSATHHVLKKAGNKTKTEAGDVTGIHKVGGSVGHAARSFSRAGKTTARSAKHELKHVKAKAHGALTKSGNHAKAAVAPH